VTTRLRNVMIYPRRLLNVFSRFLFTDGSNFAIFHILHEWLLTQRSTVHTRDVKQLVVQCSVLIIL